MAIDIVKLRNGEKVICSICNKGTMQPDNKKPEKATRFVCSSCGEKLILNIRKPSK